MPSRSCDTRRAAVSQLRHARDLSGQRARTNLHKVRLRRSLVLLVLALAGVGGSAVSPSPATASGSAVGLRAQHDRARLTSHPVSVLTDTSQHRTREQSRADAADRGPGGRAPHVARWSTSRCARDCPVLSRRERRAPERGPPHLQIAG